MILKIDRQKRSIRIWNGTVIFTAKEAVELMEVLNANASELYKLAHSYDCAECGQPHHKTIKICPTLLGLKG